MAPFVQSLTVAAPLRPSLGRAALLCVRVLAGGREGGWRDDLRERAALVVIASLPLVALIRMLMGAM